ncbi:MAG: ABC transporter ATPase [Flavobacteriaceae bacterium]|nr:MAG: ABC transporter ATPase [Flavobacteriaceae bacterium]
MFVDFEKLPDTSKIWMYQSDRKFYPNEIEGLKHKIEGFLSSWNDNGSDIISSYQFRYNRFIILAVDQTIDPITVNAIDDSVRFILQLQTDYKVALLDKLNVCFKQGDFVQYKDLKAFKKLIKSKSVSEKTIVFNNLINTKEELEADWEIPITESWHNRFL